MKPWNDAELMHITVTCLTIMTPSHPPAMRPDMRSRKFSRQEP